LGLLSGLFPSGFPTKTLYTFLLFPIHTICPAHLTLIYFITQIILSQEYRSLSSSVWFSPLPCYLVPVRPKYSQHPTVKHPQPMILPQCQWPSFTPIQNRGNIIVLYMLIFKFLDCNLEDKRFCTDW
jgi:hypothetical protein